MLEVFSSHMGCFSMPKKKSLQTKNVAQKVSELAKEPDICIYKVGPYNLKGGL